jgi:hypothetical protein
MIDGDCSSNSRSRSICILRLSGRSRSSFRDARSLSPISWTIARQCLSSISMRFRITKPSFCKKLTQPQHRRRSCLTLSFAALPAIAISARAQCSCCNVSLLRASRPRLSGCASSSRSPRIRPQSPRIRIERNFIDQTRSQRIACLFFQRSIPRKLLVALFTQFIKLPQVQQPCALQGIGVVLTGFTQIGNVPMQRRASIVIFTHVSMRQQVCAPSRGARNVRGVTSHCQSPSFQRDKKTSRGFVPGGMRQSALELGP